MQAQVHRHAHNFREVQQCTLLSIKTGGCSEDCSYCPQSSRYKTGVKADKLMNRDVVLEAAKKVLMVRFGEMNRICFPSFILIAFHFVCSSLSTSDYCMLGCFAWAGERCW